MSAWRENIERVREALIEDADPDDEAFDALTTLTAQIEELGAVLRKFISFQNAGYLAGQAFGETYAVLCREARAALFPEDSA